MENKGEVISKQSEKHEGGDSAIKKKRDLKLAGIMWGVLALMFWMDLLANIVGVTMGHLRFSAMSVSFAVLLATVFTFLAATTYMKVKKYGKNQAV